MKQGPRLAKPRRLGTTIEVICRDLKDKKVLVTGSSSGIGRATAILFGKQGCFVGVHYFRTTDGAQQTLHQVKKNGDGVLLCADLRDEKEAGEMVKRFAKEAGDIDILVNNAGTLVGRMSLETATLDFYEDVLATNTKSVFLATRAALPYLKQSKGNIVNIGSVAGQDGGGDGSGIYAGAKAAVHTMTIAMAKEFAKFAIRANSVLPGFIDTRFHRQFSSPQRRKLMAQQTPLKRNGAPEDVAKAVLFLASEAAAFITGEYIAVNGGLYMRA
jgi:3-oxoacyl-[acyl-carrier protein] reductase